MSIWARLQEQIPRAEWNKLARRNAGLGAAAKVAFGKAKGSKGAVEITGFFELDKKLAGMEKKLRRKYLAKATREVSKMTKALAQSYAPHDTGALEANIRVRSLKRSRKFKLFVGSTVRVGERMFVGDQFYGGFLEFGTKVRTTKSGANRGRIEEFKYDFLSRALWTHQEAKRQLFVSQVRKWINHESERAKKPVREWDQKPMPAA